MSSPHLSDHSLPSSSRSPTPSTAPSTPQHAPPTYFVLTHAASPAFLKDLPAQTASADRVLLFCGSGPVDALLAQAADVLEDRELLSAERWEAVKARDGADDVVYFCTKSDAAKVAEGGDSVDFAKVHVQTSQLAEADALNLFTTSHLHTILTLPTPALSLHILERPPFTFPLLSASNPYTLPTLAEFRVLWHAWDLVTLGMIPPAMLHEKPIDLRHKPLFYIGHLPTFNALLLTAHLRLPMVEPRAYATLFERGIDPHVDDPAYCHSHSVVPERDEEWPGLGEVLAFRDRVRALVERTLGEVGKGERGCTRRLVRTLVMMHEHEGFHIETLLYMLIQRAGTGTLPPPGFTPPPWARLAAQWAALPAPATPAVVLGPATLALGHDDAEPSDLAHAHDAGHGYGWDNESPRRTVEVGAFRAEWRPVTNGEFLAFWRGEGGRGVGMPASWVEEGGGEILVRTLYGPIPMSYAQHWPVLTAYDDLRAYAASKGGRIPTEHELRLFLDTYNVGHAQGANTGFRNWHPLPATAGRAEEGGRGSNGGVWEWTATVLDGHDGFAGTEVFPGYSSDFFDGKHQVVLGASYATIPRLAERRTVRNFYQHNYPYPWVGARVVYDV